MRRFVIISCLAVATATPASTFGNCPEKFRSVFLGSRNSTFTQKLASSYGDLAYQLVHAEETIAELVKTGAFVTGVRANIRKGGGVTSGVLSVTTLDGTLALKTSGLQPVQSLKQQAASIIMQKVLGELGLAPRVRGILLRKELDELAIRFPQYYQQFGDGRAEYALIMDEVPGAWSQRSTEALPSEAIHWNRREIVQRIREIGQALDKLRIKAYDLQFLISRDGTPYIYDCDRYIWQSKMNRRFGNPGLYLQAHPLPKVPFLTPIQNDTDRIVNDFERMMKERFGG